MPFDFKQDLQEYIGQQSSGAPVGSSSSDIGTTAPMGGSPVRPTFNFEDDIKEYEKLETAPATEALQVDTIIENDKKIKAAEEANKQKQQEVDAEQKPYDPTGKTTEQIMAETGRQTELDQMKADGIDPNEALTMIPSTAPKTIVPTANIEIDYANEDLTKGPIAQIPDGTVGGHCGVFAQNIVKLPDGSNWRVGDYIEQKKQSIENYRKAGLAFKPGEDAPKVGNTIIMDPGHAYGHVAVINNIDKDGWATLTESNANWDKRVTNTRRVRLDNPSIVGFIRTR